MDMHNLNVRRIPGGAGGWNMEEQGVLANSLFPPFKPTHHRLAQHKAITRLRRYLHERRGRGYTEKATSEESRKPKFQLWFCP